MMTSDDVISFKSVEEYTVVDVRVVIVTINDVDTAHEKFKAELFIESKWLFSGELNGNEKWRPVWNPGLRILNILVEEKSEIWYKIGEIDGKKYVFEIQHIKGTFYEKLALKNYPFDVQNLNISIFSSSPTGKCCLIKNQSRASTVLVENFRDTQEWSLYNYVGVNENGKLAKYITDDVEHSTINFYCVVARKPGYSFWNAFYLIFLISLISIGTFSIKYTLTNSRLITVNTLILTSVSFKWVIIRDLPSIAYLTILDIYAIFGISFMSMLSLVHSFIGFFAHTFGNELDDYMLYTSAGFYALFHAIAITWLLVAIYGPRRYYKNLENQFQREESKITTQNVNFFN